MNIYRKVCLISYLYLLPFTAYCGDNVPPTPTPTPVVVIDSNVLTQFAQNVAANGNFSLAVSPGYAPKLGNGAWGLAVLGGYQASEFIGAYLRADLFDGNYTVASGSVTAQYPIHFGKLTVRPFVEAGVGTALGGAGDKNRDVFAIAGGGAMIDLWQSKDAKQSLSVLGAVETWQPTYSGISIYRVGAVYSLHF